MICPYLKRIETKTTNGVDVTTEYFMDCYGTECPFYVSEDQFRDFSTQAYCKRTVNER